MTGIRPLPGGPVRGVILDYGGTLVTFVRPEAALRAAYRRIGAMLVERGHAESATDPLHLVHAVHDRVEAQVERAEASGDPREIDIDVVYGGALADLGVTLDPQLVAAVQEIEQEAWLEGLRALPGAVDAVAALHAAGLRTCLLSNAPYRAESIRHGIDRLGLGSVLDAVLLSSITGWRKPAPEAFAAALGALGTPAEATVMVGDQLTADVRGGAAAGLRTVHVDPDGTRAGAPEATVVIRSVAVLPSVFGVAASDHR